MTEAFILTINPIEFVRFDHKQIAQFSLIRKGFITVAEQRELDVSLYEQNKLQLKAIKLIHRISTEQNITPEIAAQVIERPHDFLQIVESYLDDIEGIWETQIASAPDISIQEVTVIIRHRLIGESKIAELKALSPIEQRKYLSSRKPCDWNVEDTKELPSELLRQIEVFIKEEREEKKDLPAPLQPPNKLTDWSGSFQPESLTGTASSGKLTPVASEMTSDSTI